MLASGHAASAPAPYIEAQPHVAARLRQPAPAANAARVGALLWAIGLGLSAYTRRADAAVLAAGDKVGLEMRHYELEYGLTLLTLLTLLLAYLILLGLWPGDATLRA